MNFSRSLCGGSWDIETDELEIFALELLIFLGVWGGGEIFEAPSDIIELFDGFEGKAFWYGGKGISFLFWKPCFIFLNPYNILSSHFTLTFFLKRRSLRRGAFFQAAAILGGEAESFPIFDSERPIREVLDFFGFDTTLDCFG